MARSKSWKERRVSFLVSDAHHVIKPVSITMPVRLKDRAIDGLPTFEGPINTVWETQVKPRLTDMSDPLSDFGSGPDLVGVLIASDEMLDFGRINWLQQSEISTEEAGADLIGSPAAQTEDA